MKIFILLRWIYFHIKYLFLEKRGEFFDWFTSQPPRLSESNKINSRFTPLPYFFHIYLHVFSEIFFFINKFGPEKREVTVPPHLTADIDLYSNDDNGATHVPLFGPEGGEWMNSGHMLPGKWYNYYVNVNAIVGTSSSSCPVTAAIV